MAHKEYKKEDIIDEIVKKRIIEMASTKTIIVDYLQKELGYGQAYAYKLYSEARKEIVKLYEKTNIDALEEAIGQLENLQEDAKKFKNIKLALEIRKELSKIQGLHTDKIDITSGGKTITEIKLIQVNKKEDNE